jgi:pyridoxine/pyridoxamine 5'-phosphate oxidase
MNPSELLQFLQNHKLAVQASVNPENGPQAAMVGVAVTDRFEIIFDTMDGTRKAMNLAKNPKIALVFGGWEPGEERTAQVEGLADRPGGEELARLKPFYYRQYPDGIHRTPWPGLVYIRVKPDWIRFSDFHQDPPFIQVFHRGELAVE